MAEEAIKPAKTEVIQDKPVESEEQTKMKVFFDEYVALSTKHGYDIGARLNVTPEKIEAVPIIIKLQTPNEGK